MVNLAVTCTHPGRYDNQLQARLYEYTTSNAVKIRTASDRRRLARIAQVTGNPVDIPDHVPVDWMHCVCEVIMKRQLFKRWLHPCYSTYPYSLLGHVGDLDEVFLSIRVPHDFTRKPRSFVELKQWKASVPVVCSFCWTSLSSRCCSSDEFKVDHFYYFALLSTALRFLHSVPVSKGCVEKAQVLLDNFVRLLPGLYGVEECTYNSHALLHFPSQVLEHGPLSFTSAFGFEAFIAHLKNLYSGTRGIPGQMVAKGM